MKRRSFIATAGAALTAPLALFASKSDKPNNVLTGQEGGWTEREWVDGGVNFVEFHMEVSQSPELEVIDSTERIMSPFFDLSQGDDVIEKALEHSLKLFENRGGEVPKYCHIIRVNGRPDIVGIACYWQRLKPITDFYKRIEHPENPDWGVYHKWSGPGKSAIYRDDSRGLRFWL